MELTIRSATPADLSDLLTLDEICFPPDDAGREPAAPQEFENGLSQDRVRVAQFGEQIVGFLQYEIPSRHHLYIGGLATHPDFRRQGIARALLDHLLSQIDQSEPSESKSVSTVTSPDNLEMLSLLLSRGFVVRTIMENYFGPGRHRFYCQYKVKIEYVDPDERYIVPVPALAHIITLLSSERYVITSLVELPAGPAFEISRFERDDFASLQSDETSAGITFSAGVLAAITFVLGLSFTSSNYPDGVRTILMGAALATTVSLIVYANASGELARLRSNVFGHHMKWGNVLSEFGGVYPFLISLPVTFAKVTASTWAALATAVIFSVALLVYERSRFSISVRFRQTRLTFLLTLMAGISPVLGTVSVQQSSEIATWVWTAAVAAVLTMLSVTYLFRRPAESLVPQLEQRWQSRR